MTTKLYAQSCEGCGSVTRPLTGLREDGGAMQFQVCRYCGDRLVAHPEIRNHYMPFTMVQRFGRHGRDKVRPEVAALRPSDLEDGY